MKMRKKLCKWSLLSLILLPSSALWANSTWLSAEDGDFGEDTNWNNGVPGEEDQAFISPAGDYTITLDTTRTILSLRLTGTSGEVTLDLGGHTLNATSTSTTVNQMALVLGGTTTGSRKFKISNGILEVPLTRIGTADTVEMTVDSGGLLKMTTTTDHRIGNSGNATLEVINGGKLELGTGASLLIGSHASGTGAVNVRGGSSILDSKGVEVQVGNSGVGSMLITQNAEAGFTGNVILGRLTGSTGYLEASESATVTISSILRIGHSGSGHAKFTSGAEVEASKMHIYGTSILEINGATAEVTDDSTWSTGSTYRIHLNGLDDTPLSVHSLSIASRLEVYLGDDFVVQQGNVYSIVDYNETITGSFLDENDEVLQNGDLIVVGDYTFELDYGSRSGGGTVGLTLVSIPEPALAAPVMALLLLAMAALRRRCHQC